MQEAVGFYTDLFHSVIHSAYTFIGLFLLKPSSLTRLARKNQLHDRSDVIENICHALLNGEKEKAQSLAKVDYPFQFHPKEQRKITILQSVMLFFRDGFIDRYSGQRLVYPGILRLLSIIMPQEFPFQKNWKMSECHIAYYELMPTIDHLVPVARGGPDDESNWITTSMLRNSAKSNWTLEELNWSLFPAGNLKEWDGLTSLYVELFESTFESRSVILRDKVLSIWYKLAKESLRETKPETSNLKTANTGPISEV